jgi:hypothetical protein
MADMAAPDGGSGECALTAGTMRMIIGETLRSYPELARLITPRGARWVFRHFDDENGELVGVFGWSNTGNATDVLWIFDSTECRAIRLVVGGTDAPGEIAWQHSGDLASCIDGLLAVRDSTST